jgi:DNA repair protein RadA/Sms
MILAVLGRHARLSLAGADVFVNIAGGVRVEEPGADLAVALALASAARRHALITPPGLPLACFGELGLTGELRHVAHPERRVTEARKFGLGPVIGPAAGEELDGLSAHASLRAVLAAASPQQSTEAQDQARIRRAA